MKKIFRIIILCLALTGISALINTSLSKQTADTGRDAGGSAPHGGQPAVGSAHDKAGLRL